MEPNPSVAPPCSDRFGQIWQLAPELSDRLLRISSPRRLTARTPHVFARAVWVSEHLGGLLYWGAGYFIWGFASLHSYLLHIPHFTVTLTYACTHTLRLRLLAFYFALKYPTNPKTPHTCLYPSHMVVIVYLGIDPYFHKGIILSTQTSQLTLEHCYEIVPFLDSRCRVLLCLQP